jgi:hypothetical protein
LQAAARTCSRRLRTRPVRSSAATLGAKIGPHHLRTYRNEVKVHLGSLIILLLIGVAIIVSREVSDRALEFEFRPLGLWHAKGRSEKIEIFELIATR